jgi:hypothetical protein
MTEQAEQKFEQWFETSVETDKIDAAIAKAQGQIKPAAKNAENPAFKRGSAATRYADLMAVREVGREALSGNGISVTQWPVHSDDGKVHLITRLGHAGQWMKAHASIPVTKADPQGHGSATTYIKRFALAAALGIVTSDEDDDGERAGESEGPAMSADSLADHLASIETASDLDQLKTVFVKAFAAAGKDQRAAAQVIGAKDKRKKVLEKGNGKAAQA